MLLTGRVLACYGRAAAAKRKAERARDPASQADFLEMEKCWLALAHSLEATERVTDFIGGAKVTKDLDGIITSWSKGARELFGYLAEEAVGKPVTMFIPPERQDEEYAILQRLRNGKWVDNFETVRQRKDGSPINVSLTVSPIKGAETSSVLQASPEILRSTSETRPKLLLSLARPNTEPKTCWQMCGRWCACHNLIRPTASERQSRDASRH